MTDKNTKSKTTSSRTNLDPHVSDAYDRSVELHNQLTQLSQSVPPQVDMSGVVRQATALKSSLEAAVSGGDDSTTTSETKQTENA